MSSSSTPVADHKTPPRAAPSTRWLAVTLLALAPSLGAIWLLPDFVTQDGPAHVYNAHVLLDLLDNGNASPFARVYEARIEPVPNWAGHLALMGAMRIVSPRTADRLMMTGTLLLPALLLVGLCRQVAGRPAGLAECLAAAVLSLNFLWLLGFYSFLLGVAAMLATWWHAWRGWSRAKMPPVWIITLAALLILGYFCHPISLAATVLGLGVLGFGINAERRARRLFRTALAFLPLVPLGLIYRGLMSSGGGMEPIWENLKGRSPLVAWLTQILWVDPLTVSRRNHFPWLDWDSGWLIALTPVAWLGIGLGLRLVITRPISTVARSWLVLAILLILGGLIAPDTLGKTHGFFLGQRLALIGMMALLPALTAGVTIPGPGAARVARLSVLALGVTAVLQSAAILEYAFDANRKVGAYLAAAPLVGTEQRVAGLVLNSRSAFRVNALWHVDTLLGLDTGNVVWSNYESAHYYFPVRVKPGVAHPPIQEFEKISRLDDSTEQPERLARWSQLIESHHPQIDALAIWGTEPAIDAATARWYELVPVAGDSPIRIWRHRGHPSESVPIP